MQNDFEKEITRRLQDFSLPPQPEIWQQVEAALPPQKKRHRFALWWWLPLLLLLGTGVWVGINRHSATGGKQLHGTTTYATLPTVQQASPDNTTQAQQADTAIQASPFSYSSSSKPVIEKKSSPSVPATIAPGSVHNVPSAFAIHRKVSKQLLQAEPENQKEKKALGLQQGGGGKTTGRMAGKLVSPEEITLKTTAGAGKKDAEVPDTIPEKRADSGLTASVHHPAPADSLKTSPAASEMTDSAVNKAAGTNALISSPSAALSKASRVKWHVAVGMGKSDIDGTFKYAGAAYQSANPITGGGSSYTSNAFLRVKSGLSLSAGIARRQYLTNRWFWQGAFHYQLLTSTQLTGGDDTASLKNVKIKEAYYLGVSFNRKNYTHQLQLLPHIGYSIPMGASLSVTLLAGFAAGYSFSTNQLLNDYTTDKYIRSGYYTNRWYAAIDGGLEIDWRKKLRIGFLYQQSLTNMGKAALGSDFRWQLWRVQVGIPLSFRFAK